MEPKRSFLENNWEKAMELENFLTKNQYFSKSSLPGIADCTMYHLFHKECTCIAYAVPNKNKYPSLYYWFINIKQFSVEAIKSWAIPSDQDKYFDDILTSYLRSGQSDPSEVVLSLGPSFEIGPCLHEYSMNIKTSSQNGQVMEKLRIQVSKHANITKYQPVQDQLRINFKCSQSSAEQVKENIGQCKQVQNYEIKKQKFQRKSLSVTPRLSNR